MEDLVGVAVADPVEDRRVGEGALQRVIRSSHRGAKLSRLVVAGGVAANGSLSAALAKAARECEFELTIAPANLCTDNGAMVAWAGLERLDLGMIDGLDAAPRARWPLDTSRAGVAGAKS